MLYVTHRTQAVIKLIGAPSLANPSSYAPSTIPLLANNTRNTQHRPLSPASRRLASMSPVEMFQGLLRYGTVLERALQKVGEGT
jgi:hypothetical protein